VSALAAPIDLGRTQIATNSIDDAGDLAAKMGSNVVPRVINAQVLIDPVCGAPSSVASSYRSVHGGAIFFFCSEECHTHFSADPARFVDVHVLAQDTAGHAASLPAPRVRQLPVRSTRGERAVRNPVRELEYVLRGMIASWLLAWREERHAARTSRTMLRHYEAISAANPQLKRLELYTLVVMAHKRCDAPAASRVLEHAEECFIDYWPVNRELTLRDVSHYIAVSEYLQLHGENFWIRSEFESVIASHIPRNL
jgi:YHS domain-containing protein